MIGQIIADVQALDVAVLGELFEEVLVEILEVLLDVGGVEVGVGLSLWGRVGQHVGALVHVGEAECGADGGLRVEPRAPVTMPASPDLEVEGAVHPILLCPEYRRQVFRHSHCSGCCTDFLQIKKKKKKNQLYLSLFSYPSLDSDRSRVLYFF